MKTLFTPLRAFCLLFSFVCFKAHAQVWDWTKPEPNGIIQGHLQFGNEGEAAHELATDAQGYVYVLGDYQDSLYLNNNFITKGRGSYIAKYDSSGTLYWYKLITLQNDDGTEYWGNPKASDFVINSTGIYITGSLAGPPGAVPYNYTIGSSVFFVDTTGDYLYGATNEFFLCKMDFNGAVVWNKTSHHGAAASLQGCSITTDKSNNIIISGVKNNWSCCGNYQSNFLLGNDFITDNSGLPYYYKIFVVKYNSAGVLQWSSFINDNNYPNQQDEAVSMASDNSNNIWLYSFVPSGTYFGNTQFVSAHNTYSLNTLSKINSSGNFLFTRELSTLASDDLGGGKSHFITCDNSNNLYAIVNLGTEFTDVTPFLNGNISVPTGRFSDLYILKYKSNGNLVWFKKVGGNTLGEDDYATQINYNSGKLYYSGSVRSEYISGLYFSFYPLTVPDLNSTGTLKYFVAKSDTAANFDWVNLFSANSNAQGLSVAPFGNNIYTSGTYRIQINDLGNLNGSFINTDGEISNQFFGKLKDQYIRVGAVTPTSIIPGCTLIIPFTSTGLTFSSGNTFTAELSDANGIFASPTAIGSIISTGTGTITATIPASLTYGSGYRVRIRSSDTLKTGYNYYAYADTAYKLNLVCPPPSTGFAATNITATSATLNWTAVGCAAGYKVQYRVKGTTVWTTAPVITTNTATANLTGLTASTIYQWRVATRCKNNGTTSFSAFSAIKTFTTTAAFALSITSEDLKLQTSGFAVYPNPAKQMATVQFSTSKTDNCVIEVADLAGRVLYRTSIAATTGVNKQNINLNMLAAGVYLVTLTQSSLAKQTLKLNKE